MQVIRHGYAGLTLFVELNWDRAFFFSGLAAALLAGAYLGTPVP